jgi:hypothetical protein
LIIPLNIYTNIKIFLNIYVQVQTESNELRARFEYAAQEINKQEKVIDDLKEEERVRVASGSDDQVYISIFVYLHIHNIFFMYGM